MTGLCVQPSSSASVTVTYGCLQIHAEKDKVPLQSTLRLLLRVRRHVNIKKLSL
jgi:hypothetical protein